MKQFDTYDKEAGMTTRITSASYQKMRWTITAEADMVRLNWDRTHNGLIENSQRWFGSVAQAQEELDRALEEYRQMLNAHGKKHKK